MLQLLPLAFTVARLAGALADGARLEITAAGDEARRLAADVLVDADAIADIVIVDDGAAAIFEVALHGERHELRVELDPRGRVVGASVWWLGDEPRFDRFDLSDAVPALLESERLDAVTSDGAAVQIEAGGAVVSIDDYGC